MDVEASAEVVLASFHFQWAAYLTRLMAFEQKFKLISVLFSL